MIIDSHQHFWKYDPQTYGWINDKMEVIKKDFLPDELFMEMQSNGIDACVAVQAEQSEMETEFLCSLSIKNPFIKGVVGWVDLQSNNVEEQLEKYSESSQIKGFRHIVQDEPDTFMFKSSFQQGIGHLLKYGFTYDILIYSHQLPSAVELVTRFPNQRFVLDHMAKPSIKTGEMDAWMDGISKLAEFENVSCKVSGMITEAKWNAWDYDHFIPFMDVIFETFGVKRIMFGSDWPVCLLSGSYQQVKSIVTKYISELSRDEQSDIMGHNAIEFYQLSKAV